jgi:endonuclease-8
VPEGDTIHRTAQALDRALAGAEVVRFETPRLRHDAFPSGTRVDGVDAVGKHCLVHFDDGRTLRTHLGMGGSWHLYRPGERWRRTPGAMRAVVGVPDWDAVCFGAPTVELTSEPAVDHLGPDLCIDTPDIDLAVERLGALVDPSTTIGDALLDQRVASGIGNIWKNEACFACAIDPATPIALVDAAERRRVFDAAAARLRASVAGSRPAMAVYGRAGHECRRCGGNVIWARQGRPPRGTYWCPACQPARTGTAST